MTNTYLDYDSPKCFTIREATFWICRKQPTKRIVAGDLQTFLYCLLNAVNSLILKAWYKNVCNLNDPDKKFVAVDWTVAHEIYIDPVDLKYFLEILSSWLEESPKHKNKHVIHNFPEFEKYLKMAGGFTSTPDITLSKIKDALYRLEKPQSNISQAFEHSPDYRSVSYQGKKYSLNGTQAKVFECLHFAFKNGTPEMSNEYILESIIQTDSNNRLKDYFKKPEGKIAFKDLITSGKSKGTVRLNIQ